MTEPGGETGTEGLRERDRATGIGLALGGGAARGWAHVGVLRVLEELGVRPDVVCGASIGALVGLYYASGRLDALEESIGELEPDTVSAYFSVNLTARGGFVDGSRLEAFLETQFADAHIQDLERTYAAVATSLNTGRAVSLDSGSAVRAVRASIALPGIFTPVEYDGDWLVDGGLVQPVPVSLCRELGASRVIAVNLNEGLVQNGGREATASGALDAEGGAEEEDEAGLLSGMADGIEDLVEAVIPQSWRDYSKKPGVFDVLMTSIDIVQEHLTRARLAQDTPDVLISPRLSHIGPFEFSRGAEAIRIGRETAEESREDLNDLLERKA